MPTDNKSSMPSHKTPGGRSRRRKQVQTATSDDKENLKHHYGGGRGSSKSLADGLLDDDNVPSLHVKGKEVTNSTDKRAEGDVRKRARQQFRQSLDRVTVTASSLWEKDHPERLVEFVIGSSLTNDDKRGSNNGAFLVLDEHGSALLSFSRKLIKDVADVKTGTETTTKTTMLQAPADNLFVAVHILRSVAFALSDSISLEKRESLLKMLYHLITTASHYALMDDDTDTHAMDDFRIKLGLIAMAGYEGLGYALSNYSTRPNDQKNVTTFEVVFDSNRDQRRPLFAVPRKSSKSKMGDPGSMDIQQLCTIALKITAVVARTICGLFCQPSSNSPESRPYSMYGRLGSAIENDPDNIHELAINIMAAVQQPWLDLLAKVIFNAEKDVLKEVTTFAKGWHRVLWDAASNLKASQLIRSTTSTTQHSVEEICLEFRKHGILLLLPETSVPKVNKIVRKSSLDLACTFAWKAATVFHQNTWGSTSGLELSSFYEEVDAKFQSFLQLEADIPFEYSEFLAYKALHTSSTQRSPILFDITNSPLMSAQKENQNSDHRLVYNILQIGAWCKSRIESSLQGGLSPDNTQQNEDSTVDAIRLMESSTQAFRERYLEGSTDSQDTLKRAYKIFGILAIQKTLFSALKRDDLTWSSISTELHVGASFLECLGNVGIELLTVAPAKAPQLLDMIIECQVRPILVYEKLSLSCELEEDHQSSRRYISLSDEMCTKYYDTIIMLFENMEDFPMSLLVKAAKWFAVISRQRSDRSLAKESILPLLYSIRLYMLLDEQHGESHDTQLPQRLALLSNTFNFIGKYDDGFFLLCLALNFELTREGADEVSKEIDILVFLANKSDGVFPPVSDAPALSQKSLSMCRRMALHLFDRPKTLSFSNDAIGCCPSVISAFDSFVQRFRVGIENSDTTLAIEILFKRENQRGGMSGFFALVETLCHLGHSIHHSSVDCDTETDQSQTAKLNHSLLACLLRKHCEDNVARQELLDVVISASMAPIGRRRWTYSDFQDSKTDPPLTNDLSNNAKDLTRNQEADCLLHSIHLSNISLKLATGEQTVDLVFPTIVEGAKSATQPAASSDDDIYLLAKKWTIWAVSNITNLCETRGCKEKATVLSLWLIALTENDHFSRIWYTSTLLSTCADENNTACLAGPYNFVSTKGEDAGSLSESTHQLFEIELDLCRRHLQTLNSGADCATSYSRQASFLGGLFRQLECRASDNDQLLHLWVMSTLCLVHSDLAASYGYFPSALHWTQQCMRYCQAIMKQANFNFQSTASVIVEASATSILARATLRYIQVLSKRPKLHYRLGDYRKADAYIRSVLDFLKIGTDRLEEDEERPNQLQQLLRSLNAAPEVRLFLEMASWASTPEQTIEELTNGSIALFPDRSPSGPDTEIVDSIQNLIAAGDILYGESVSVVFKNAFVPFYEEAIRHVAENENVTKLDSLFLPHRADDFVGVAISKQIELRKARLLVESTHLLDEESVADIRTLCSEIIDSHFSCAEDKAWALYYLGLLELDEARHLGTLQEMWQLDDYTEDDFNCTHLSTAKLLLRRASLHTMNASDVLTRNILRSLALASGPSGDDSMGMSSGILVLSSIGQSLRRRMTWSFSSANDQHSGCESEDQWQHIFSIFDGPPREDEDRDVQIAEFLKQLADLTPSCWTFAAPVICPSGEILVTSLEKVSSRDEYTISTVCIFPPHGMTGYDCIMKPLDTILQQVQDQLHSVDPMVLPESLDKEAMKRKWWEERGRLDEDLGSLLCEVDSMFFSKAFVHERTEDVDFYDDLPRGNLASKFDEALDDVPGNSSLCHDDRIDGMKALTVPKLKQRLVSAGVDESLFKKLKKAELIELLIEYESKSPDLDTSYQDGAPNKRNRVDDCLFLILDENLHRFPFEGMPSLEKRTVCRIPCLSFVLSTLCEHDDGKLPSVDPSKTTYVLDPEKNLQGTRRRLLPVIKCAESSGNWNWDGVVGEVPSPSFFQRGLMVDEGLLVYFGHGGAQTCFSRRRIEELIDHRVQALQGLQEGSSCRASVVLMGCSSGRLVSINRKNCESIEQVPLYYEPEGVALTYLCAGSPCVVGNLWDVTDNDIDRFSIALLDNFLECGANLAESIALSRPACKLKYLVGCAPVCYGVPVKPLHTSRVEAKK